MNSLMLKRGSPLGWTCALKRFPLFETGGRVGWAVLPKAKGHLVATSRNFLVYCFHPVCVLNLQGYPGAAPGYPGPPHPFSSGGQYSYGGSPQAAAAMAAAAGHPGLMQQQQQQALSAGHRFTPPTEGTSSGSRPDPAIADGASYPVSSHGTPVYLMHM